jgi:hypothetical protein
MVATKQCGLVTYTGFDTENNGKFSVDTKGNWTYVNYQKHEFLQVICGYVVKQDDGRHKAYQLGDRNVKYFDLVDDGVEYIKSLWRKQHE